MSVWQSGTMLWRRRGWLLSCHTGLAQVQIIEIRRVSSKLQPLAAFQDKPRTAEDLPFVSLLEMMYRLTFGGFLGRIHELQMYEKQRYGPIYRNGMKTVCVNTPKLLEEILRNDDKFPVRGDMSPWKEYRDMRGYGYGLFSEDGEKWYNLRTVLNKHLLHQRDSAQYGDTINDIVTDFIKRICYLRQCSTTGDLVTDVGNELYRFSLEGIASILLETRVGCLEKRIPEGTQEFINSISEMFSNNLAVMIMPRWSRNLLPYWGRYTAGWDGIFSFATNLIDKKFQFIHQCLDNNEEVKGGYLTYLLSHTEMSPKDVYGNVTELLLAGVDTTSNTLTWTLHLLSLNPESQARLYKEVSALVPSDGIPSAEEVTQMPYLRAVIKESLRMYPVVIMNGRFVAAKDVVIGGYQFSKNTGFTFSNFAISHDEDTFPESFTFKPERWLRDGHDRPNPFGAIPFGFGVRSCVGRRIAELEMYLFLCRLIRKFEIKPDPKMGELKCISRTVLVPNKPVSFHFVDRGSETT